MYSFVLKNIKIAYNKYRIRGLFGGHFNLVVWQIFIGSPNLNYAIFRSNLFYLQSAWHGKVLYMAAKPEQRLKCLL